MKRCCLIYVILFLLITLSVSGQDDGKKYTLSDTSLAQYHGTRYKKFLQQTAMYDSMIFHHNKALKIYQALAEQTGQEKYWEETLKISYQAGHFLQMAGEYDKSLHHLQKGLELGKKYLPDIHPHVLRHYTLIGNAYGYKGEYFKAIDNFMITINKNRNKPHKKKSLANDMENIGICYTYIGNFEEAIKWFDKALEIKLQVYDENDQKLAMAYHSIGGFFLSKGNYEKSIEYQNIALQKYLSIPQEKQNNSDMFINRLSDCYSNLALAHSEKGDHSKALDFQHKAVQTRFVVYQKEDNIGFAGSYSTLSKIYLKNGNYNEALRYNQKALDVRLRLIKSKDHIEVADVYKNFGNIYNEMGNHPKALNNYNTALKIYNSQTPKIRSGISDMHHKIAGIYLKSEDYYNTYKQLDTAFRIAEEVYGPNSIKVADIKQSYGKVFLQQKQFEKSLKWLNESIKVLTQGNNNTPRESTTNRHALLLLSSLELKITALENQNREQKSNHLKLESALKICQQAFDLYDQIRREFYAENSKLELSETSSNIYEQAIRIALKLEKITGNEDYKEKAFGYLNRRKAAILAETITDTKAKDFAGIPDSILKRERNLKIDIFGYTKNLLLEREKAEKGDSLRIEFFQSKLFELKREHEQFITNLEKTYPTYFELKYDVKESSVKEIRKILDGQTTLVDYLLGDTTIYIFTVSQKQFEITPIHHHSNITSSVSQLRSSIINRVYPDYIAEASQLYKIVIQPVAHLLKTKQLIIVPDGVLHTIPFDALLSELPVSPHKMQDYTSLPYLKNRFAISYAYSTPLLLEMLKPENSEAEYDYLAFAPVFSDGLPDYTRGAKLFDENYALDSTRGLPTTQLLATRNEVEGIQKAFTDSYNIWENISNWLMEKTKLYIDDEANEAQLKSADLDKYRYIHFATHGFANQNTPELSGLMLIPDTTSKEDNVLYLNEVYNLDLNAELVTLSACETGIGKLTRGEGVLSLARGFLYSGAKNLLVSQWQVNDYSTSELMIQFYKEMLAGKSKTAALRDAKNDLINSYPDTYAAPYYWASFILIGQ